MTPIAKRKLKPLKKFLIFPDAGWIFVRVYIWRTKAEMLQAVAEDIPFEAICKGGDVYRLLRKRWRFVGGIAELHFHQKYVRSGVIVHECCHATHRYMRFRKRYHPIEFLYKQGKHDVSAREETFCWIMGNLVREFFIKMHLKRPRREPIRCSQKVFVPMPFLDISYPENWDGRERRSQLRIRKPAPSRRPARP